MSSSGLTLEKMVDLILAFLEGNPESFKDKRDMLISICEHYQIRHTLTEKQESLIKYYYPKVYQAVSERDKFKSSDPRIKESYLRSKYAWSRFLITEDHPSLRIKELVDKGYIFPMTYYDGWKAIVEHINNTELEDLNNARVALGQQALKRLYFKEGEGWYSYGDNVLRLALEKSEFTSSFRIDKVRLGSQLYLDNDF